MAKNKIRDWSTNPDDNTDVGGVGIQGSNLPSNLDNAQRTMMSQVADVNDGNETVDDTWGFNDPDDASKKFRFDGGDVTGSIVISAKKLYDFSQASVNILETAARRGAPTITPYTASGTHTFAEGTAFYQIVAVGAGGGSGAVDGTGAGTGGSTAGGNSGFFGVSTIFAKGALTTGTVVIGAGGTAGTSPAPVTAGGDGGDTTWADATIGTLTFKGGKGSPEITATSGHIFGLPLANGASSVSGSYSPGGPGMTNSNSDAGGIGGSTDWGSGGIPTLAFGGVANGVSGSGYGAGASGAASVGVGTNAAGAAGTGGRLEVWEW
jgi:hypothetical protein